MIETKTKPNTEEAIKKILTKSVNEWFFSKFKEFSLPQLYGVMEIHSRNNTLVSAPTGSSKTLTSFLSILNELVDSAEKGILKDKVYAVYISPLKALNNDVQRNLVEPLQEIEKISGRNHGIRVAVRTGDTTQSEKAKMLKNSPHILITTPESLAILLSSIKFREKLREVEWVVIDEIHALADNKRGVHLSLSLEKLQHLSPALCRIGLSATISPLEEIAKFLVGSKRDCKIIDVQFIKQLDLQVISPVPDLVNVSYEKLSNASYAMIDKLIQQHKTTLIFTNTRSGTERVVHHLKTKFPGNYYEIEDGHPTKVSSLIGAHHGSLSKEHRLRIESSLREGKLRAVCCSTSLELGIDIGYIDLVICLGSPKSVARFLQRCLPYDSEVLLEDGSYLPIGKIVEEQLPVRVISYNLKNGFVPRAIKDYHKNGKSELLEINLRCGEKIECTPEHPLLTEKGWKKAAELSEKDRIGEVLDDISLNQNEIYIYNLLPKDKTYVYGSNDYFIKLINNFCKNKGISIKDFSILSKIPYRNLLDLRRKKGRKKSILLEKFLNVCRICNINEENYLVYLKRLKYRGNSRCKLPLTLNQELMWYAGLIATDGCIVKTVDKRSNTPYFNVKFSNKNALLINQLKKTLDKHKIGYYHYTRKKDNQHSIEVGNNLIAYLLISLGIPFKNKSASLKLSPILFKLNQKLIYAFLEGVFEGDGSYNKKYPLMRIFTGSYQFAKQLHWLFARMGYHSNINKEKAKISNQVKRINLQELYCITLTRIPDIKKILMAIPKFGPKAKLSNKLAISFKQHHQKRSIVHRNIHWEDIISIQHINNPQQVYNLTIEEDANFIVGNIITHNCGRAGHKMHQTVKGRLIVMDRDDLVECSVLLKHALEKKIDRIHIPRNCLDVLAQQIMGMAIDQQWEVKELYNLIKQSYCYSELGFTEYDQILSYLAGEYALEDRHIYARIWYDRETNKIGRKGKLSRVIYMTNIGTIPDESGITVKVGNQKIGTVEEGFLERLKPGDIFVLGGDSYQFKFARGMVAQVTSASGKKPTVPSWFSEMLPLSFDLANGIQQFRKLMKEHLEKKETKLETIKFIHSHLYVDENAAAAIYNYFLEQHSYIGIPNSEELIIENYKEENRKYVIFHTLYGRRVNDALSRAVAYAIARTQHRDVEIGISDNGFYVAFPKDINVFLAFKILKAEDLREILKLAIAKSEILRRRFRHCATRAMMILRQYKGIQKNVGRQQVSSMILMNAVMRISEDFSILKESRREVMDDLMDVDNAALVLKAIKLEKIKIKEIETTIPSPFAINLVMQGYSDILRMEDKSEFLRRMHKMVLAKISKKGSKEVNAMLEEMMDKAAEIREENRDEKKEELIKLAWNVGHVPNRAKEEMIAIINGKRKNISKDFLEGYESHIQEIRENWPKKLSGFFEQAMQEIKAAN